MVMELISSQGHLIKRKLRQKTGAMMDKVREAALKALVETEKKEAYSNLVLKKILRDDIFDARDRAFITELVYGTIARKLTLDWIIARFSKTKLSKLSIWVLYILRMGVYQLLFLDRVPPSAACNTSVDLAKRYAGASRGFVNAVLRNISRSIPEFCQNDINTGSLVQDLSIQYSFPEYLVRAWLPEFGESLTRELLRALLDRPDFSVRVNTLKTGPEEVCRELSEAGITVRAGRYLPEALVLDGVSDISRVKAFTEGRILVQDESSMLAARILDPKPGEKVLDACAAPGGKTTHIAQLMKNQGHIAAWDIHEHKTDLIRENAERLGITIIHTKKRDAAEYTGEAAGRYERVLVDAPCSGTGIIRRKPDIKWQRKPEDYDALVEIQRKILYNAGRYVIPGGTLVYSTCSLDVRENEHILRDFLARNPDFKPSPPDPFLPENLRGRPGSEKGMLRLFPHTDGTDGFFIARMIRKAQEETD